MYDIGLILQIGLINPSTASLAPQRVVHAAQADAHMCCACGLKLELGKLKEEIRAAVREELKEAHERQLAEVAEAMKGQLKSFKLKIMAELKKGKAVESNTRSFVQRAERTVEEDDSNQHLLDDQDLGSTEADESFDTEKGINSEEETPEEFLPPMSKGKSDVGGSSGTEKVINLDASGPTIPSLTREVAAWDFIGFKQTYKKVEMIFCKSGGCVVGHFSVPHPFDLNDLQLAHLIFNDKLLQR